MKLRELFNYVPPPKFISDYDASEKAQFQNEFQPKAREYRIYKRIVYGLSVVIFVAVVISRMRDVFYWFFGFVGLHTFLYLLFKPACPACRRNVELRVRRFCPECGSSRILRGGFFRFTECDSCRATLRQRKGGRSYKIRYCTHCGVFLDGKGI